MKRTPVLVVVALLAAITASGVAAGAPASVGAATPDVGSAYTQAVDPTADGPVVVQADPFTRDATNLAPGQIELVSVSARPALVSGDAVRIAVRGLAASDPLTLTVDNEPSDAAFTDVASRPGQATGSREAVVRGLTPGDHSLAATSNGRTATLVVTAHDPEQTLLSGAKQTPLLCEAESGLPAPAGPDCTFPPTVHYWYENLAQQFTQLSDPTAPYPADLAMTTTEDGRTVPFVVRVDNVVLNDSTTQIAVLDDPHARGTAPFAAAEWDHDVLYHFGESCGTGFHQGTENESDVFGSPTSLSLSNIAGPLLGLPQRLGEGTIVVQSTRTIFGVACNPVLSAETVNDILGRIWTDYGDIRHVIGGGGSGGAIQQITLANDYPGPLDGITPTLEFPDLVSQLQTIGDCTVMSRLFSADPTRWTPDKEIAVTGLQVPTACPDWASEIGKDFNVGNCPDGISAVTRYNPATNPKGVRCDLQDDLENWLGTSAVTGAAERPFDNVGIEYGLSALETGRITGDDFVALNTGAGGIDLDGNSTTTRTDMGAAESRRMYALGLINDRGALNQVPIIDQSIPAFQDTPNADIHDEIRPFETRARLDRFYGGHGNQAIWVGAPLPSAAVVTMREWLTALDGLQARNPTMTRAQIVTVSRPADAGDQCEVAGVAATQACAQGVLVASGTRQVAGGPLTEDVIKCQLKPFNPVPGLTDAQDAAVAATFTSGVCDYSKPGAGDSYAVTPTWLSFGSERTLSAPITVDYPIARSALSRAGATKTPTRARRAATRRKARKAVVAASVTAPRRTLAYTGAGWPLPLVALLLLGCALLVARRTLHPMGPS